MTLDHKAAQKAAFIKEDPAIREYYAFQEKFPNPPPYQLVWKRAWELAIKSVTPDNDDNLHIGWEGYFCLGQGEVWYWCRVIAFDDGEPVIRTRKGYYHRRPHTHYRFRKVAPKGATTK